MASARIVDLLRKGQVNDSYLVRGWVRTKREGKGIAFLELNDGSSLQGLQIVLPQDLDGYETLVKQITTGTSIEVSGILVESMGKGQRVEMQATAIAVFGTADPETYPLQKKRHSIEFLRTIAHLRPRTNMFGAVFRVRNACAFAIHQFFQERGFLWVHTPIVTASDCEGAGEMFGVTTLDLNKVAATGKPVDFSQDFFGKPAFLTVSGQLEAEIMATAFSNVYTFGPTFRAENSNTSRHLAEFWMIEPEMAFCDLEGDADLAEDFLKYIFNYVLATCPKDMEFFQERVNDRVMVNAQKIVEEKFERITYTEAIAILENCSKTFEYPVQWGLDLQSEHERFLAEEHFQKPVIVMDYPLGIKAFYMRVNEGTASDRQTVRAMDILAPGVGEIIGGSQREERLDVLESRIRNVGLNPEDYWWYLDLRRYGTVPHAGFGLGFERLVQFITGMGNIRDVIPFPRFPQNAEF
ncbi:MULTISPECIES: asparagine--tRNA ligase [Pseudanabaena]|uniref:Asparagine--tRNA ligase n=2 Tax=Pseudanabaena TaxID=1152 RepID=L8N2N8_9CYAN|nr:MULTISPECIES: asparagine--tRNA ligase [Pseudanabaena]ELS33961.1 asparaginyl-tRNA synthetase [Pseudanabaena biceps PCC 7429]MDG3493807.1 asparagine--tRNA ligase [Pseudanabaena catenata USMAC16]